MMKRKVTLKEILGTRVILAILVAVYYWMWARRDWETYYLLIQNMIGIFTIVFFLLQSARIRKYHREDFDELAIANLKRSDAICLKLAIVFMIIAAFLGVIFTAFMGAAAAILEGYFLVGSLVVLSIVRTVIFSVMDRKGV